MRGSDETDRRGFWNGTRLVLAGLVVALLLLLARYGPYWLRRAGVRQLGSQSSASATGQLRPLQWVEDTVANLLAGVLVEKPPPGQGMTPKLRYEQPWPEWLFLALFVGSVTLVVWLYRREGAAPTWAKATLAGLRIGLIFVAMLLLSEIVLTVDRTGLSTFAILVDDSASAHIADPYADAAQQTKARELARAAGRDQPDRLALALGWLKRDDAAFVKTLARQQKLRFYRVSDQTVPIAEIDRPEQIPAALASLAKLSAEGSQSRLGDAVTGVLSELRGTPPTAILLLTDGQNTDGASLADAAEAARKAGVPLFSVGVGDERPPRDLALSDLQVDEIVFVGDTVRFVARLTAQGFDDSAGARGARPMTNVTLKRLPPGARSGARPETLETLRVPIPPDGRPQAIEISHRPTEVGSTTYILEVTPDPRELQRDNNRLERVIEVRDQKLKVLYVEGEPRYEFRWLKTYLERDTTIDLSVLLQSGDERYAEQDRSAIGEFPRNIEGPKGLFSYDVVILGDVDPSLMNTQQMRDIVEFVTRKGGGLMLIAGERHNPLDFRGKPLEPLLPIRLEDARNPAATGPPVEPLSLALTPEGRANPIFRLGDDEEASRQIWNGLAPMYWYFEAPHKQPTAAVLAEHPTKQGAEGNLPLVVYQYVGAGKVLFSGVDETWRWRLRVGDQHFGRYWVQMLRFMARSKLMGQKPLEITTDRKRYPRGQTVQVQVRFLNPALAQNIKTVSVQLSKPGEAPRIVALRPLPGTNSAAFFEAAVSGLTEGTYTASYLPPPAVQGDLPATDFIVDPPAGEYAHVEMNRAGLTAAARSTGGQFFRWDENRKLVEVSPSTDTDTPGAASGQSTSTVPKVERSLLELLPPAQKVPLDSDPPVILWNTWPMLATFLFLIAAEWVLRKRMQMV